MMLITMVMTIMIVIWVSPGEVHLHRVVLQLLVHLSNIKLTTFLRLLSCLSIMLQGINNNVDSHHGGIVVHISPLRRNGDPLVVLRSHGTIELQHIVRSAKHRYILFRHIFLVVSCQR